MASRSFRNRFFTPPVARAIMSPLGILAFGVVAAGGILAGLPLVAGLGAGAVVWAGNVFRSVPKAAKAADRIDPFTLSEPWRGYVQAAQSAKLRFDRTVQGTRPGPIQDRLHEMGTRLDDAIEDCWRVASRGDDIDSAIAQLNTAEAQLDLAETRKRIRERGVTPDLESTERSLQAQIASHQRMRTVSEDTRDRLRLLDARFDELVAQAAEVSVGAGDTAGLSDDIDGLASELEALRLALEETDRAASGRMDLPSLGQQPAPAPQPRTFPSPEQTSPPS